MEYSIIYRHNIMKISSIDTFLSIRGGFNKGQRDVYFVRILGCMTNMNQKILEIDRRMNLESKNSGIDYIRVKELPKIHNFEEMQFYAEQYEKWKIQKIITIKNNQERLFSGVLGQALIAVLEEYRKIKVTTTETMEKNFVIKMISWLDRVLKDSLGQWNERKCIKVIAENITKVQEYLFYYLLTLVGCDVLLLQYRNDIEVAKELKSKSTEIRVGQFGSINLPEYCPQTAKNKEDREKDHKGIIEESAVSGQADEKNNIVNNTTNRITADQSKAEQNHISTISRQQICRPDRKTKEAIDSTAPISNTSEKNFEELALLASSVVMITVFNRYGEPECTGSGIMIGKDGYILTNNHVIEDGGIFVVKIEDDENVYEADGVMKCNNMLDLAIIRINKRLNPIPIYKGRKKLVRGQNVVAIGSPLGLFNSVSNGIISGFRKIKDVEMIQFTAPISHGSSGGAVLNMQGQIIGISTAGIDEGQNINLAVTYEDILVFARGFY